MCSCERPAGAHDHAVADFVSLDTTSDLGDDTTAFVAETATNRGLLNDHSHGDQNILEVQPDSFDFNFDLVVCKFVERHLSPIHCVWKTGLVDVELPNH